MTPEPAFLHDALALPFDEAATDHLDDTRSPASPAAQPEALGDQATHGAADERYTDLQPLAAGGMAFVYRALDTRTRSYVALKVLAPEFAADPVQVERFCLEARRMQALRHPHIVPLLDFGEYQGHLYLAMPLYPASLLQQMRRYGLPPLAHAVRIIGQTASALDYANALGIVHRDVKPSNILLDANGQANLTDFGIAKGTAQAPEALKTMGPIRAAEANKGPFATPGYSAPEHLTGQPVDARTDVYGLAIVAYQLLTGRVPFALEQDGQNLSAAQHAYSFLVRILTERPAPPSELSPYRLPAGLDAAIMRALEREPDRRYPTVGAFYQAIWRAVAQ